ncbi:CPBP family intramembrane glutamic endopeptidase [Bacillus sp. JJ1764]|uniref:CPBP family intramembrane glutamic endopeptidase n=1 Tax=Bacillus sp. JJ1764 TaxID=3122964 RepID=UPI003000987A
MTTNLTQTISKKLLVALLIVAIGAEILLYVSRYSYLASTLYDAVMVASIFVGMKLHPRLRDEHAAPKTKRQLTLQFTGAFLLFFLGSTIINIYSNMVFKDFSTDYDQYVQAYTEIQSGVPENHAPKMTPFWSFIDKIDTIGDDLYTDSLAGLEEVWRLAYIILILLVCKKLFSKRWETGSRDPFLMVALFLTSVIFGVDHTLDTESAWTVKIGTIVTFANMGFLFGIILLWTRNLWLTVLVHSIYDITATVSWYYLDYAVELFALVVLIVHITLFIMEKRKNRQIRLVENVHTNIAE